MGGIKESASKTVLLTHTSGQDSLRHQSGAGLSASPPLGSHSCSVHFFCPFSNWIVWGFLPLSFKSLLYILDNSSLLDVLFENIFS